MSAVLVGERVVEPASSPSTVRAIRRAVVTGGTGFLGGGLVRHLRAEGIEVVATVRPSSDARPLESLGARPVALDLLDPDALAPVFEGADAVFHLAAQLRAPWRPDYDRFNSEGCGRIAEACARLARPPVLVLASSLAAGGPSPPDGPARREEDLEGPCSRYGRAKLGGERAVLAFADRVPTSVVRPPIVIGPGDRCTGPLLKMLRRGLAIVPSGPPFSFVHVDDLARLFLEVARKGERAPAAPGLRPGQGIYYSSAEEEASLVDLARRLAAAAGLAPRVVPLPAWTILLITLAGEVLGRLTDRPTTLNLDKAKDVRAGSWRCDSRKAVTELGWVHAPLAEHIARAPGWWPR